MNGIQKNPSVPCQHCGELCHKSNVSLKYIHDKTTQRLCWSEAEKGWLKTKATPKEPTQ